MDWREEDKLPLRDEVMALHRQMIKPALKMIEDATLAMPPDMTPMELMAYRKALIASATIAAHLIFESGDTIGAVELFSDAIEETLENLEQRRLGEE